MLYIDIANIPNSSPAIFPIAVIRPEYNWLDSGINSPDTIYIMAPAANDKQIAIILCDIPPMIAPKNAPIPVVIPDKIT